jgi:hypothetical protein
MVSFSINVYNIGLIKVKNKSIILIFVLIMKKNMLIIQFGDLQYLID